MVERARSPSCSPTPVRGGTARSTSSSSRRCWAAARSADPSGSCWQRWPHWRTRKEPCATSPPSSCAWRQVSRTGHTGARGLRCWRQAQSSWSTASAAAGTRTCGWSAIRASSATLSASRVPRRVAPPAGARPLIASAGSPGAAAQVQESATRTGGKGGQDRTLTAGNSPILTGVSGSKGGHDRTVRREKCPVLTGVSGSKGGQDQTLFELAPLETPAAKPRQKPRHPTRAREGNPRTPEPGKTPPTPLKGGARRTRSSSRRPTSPRAAASDGDAVRIDLDEVRRGLGIPSVCRSRRLGADPKPRRARPSARARSRSGSSRSS